MIKSPGHPTEHLVICPVLSYPSPGSHYVLLTIGFASLFPSLGGMMMAFMPRSHKFTEIVEHGQSANKKVKKT